MTDLREAAQMAHLWECLGRWSAYLVTNGEQANCAPPSWLCDAINAATATPQREFIGLTDDDFIGLTTPQIFAMKFAEAKLREKNT